MACVQNFYNIANRADAAVLAATAEQHIAYVPYFPLGGFSPLLLEEVEGLFVVPDGCAVTPGHVPVRADEDGAGLVRPDGYARVPHCPRQPTPHGSLARPMEHREMAAAVVAATTG